MVYYYLCNSPTIPPAKPHPEYYLAMKIVAKLYRGYYLVTTVIAKLYPGNDLAAKILHTGFSFGTTFVAKLYTGCSLVQGMAWLLHLLYSHVDYMAVPFVFPHMFPMI